MFGKKSRKKNQKEAPEQEAAPKLDHRFHAEGLGDVWAALTGQNPAAIMPQVIGTVIHDGGTRPAWQWQRGNEEFIFMAWPQDQPIRAGVLMAGPKGAQLKPVTAVPLLEGYPNDLQVAEVHPRLEGLGADVAVTMIEDKNPMWFFDPLYGRDQPDLTPGIMHTFWLSAVAFGIRKALLDYVSIASGPQFEAHAEKWLAENPDASRTDVPPLKVEIKDKHFIMPGRHFGEYQLRAVITDIEEMAFDKMPVKALHLVFPFDNRPDMHLPLFVSDHVLGDFKPEKDQEIEAYAWFQGRIIDLDSGVGGQE